jgi:predicted esterase
MTIIKPRSKVLGSALAVLLAAAVVTTGPPAAAQPAANPNCGAPVMFGLHGMGEGPSSNTLKGFTNLSPEIMGFDAAQNRLSGAIGMDYVAYPTVTASYWDVLTLANVGPLTNAVNAGESALQSAVASWTSGCSLSQDKIALIGYSMGAWIVNKWLKDHPGEWLLISAVVLYGDPCWKYHSDQGLARLFGVAGCSPAKNYPYPAPSGVLQVPFKAQSLCAYHDPVCGGGYASNENAQLSAAENCKVGSSCPHLQYTRGAPSSGPLYEGARFVVQKLLGLCRLRCPAFMARTGSPELRYRC